MDFALQNLPLSSKFPLALTLGGLDDGEINEDF